MANKVDLNRLKTEIDSRKKEKNNMVTTNVGTGIIPRDTFLNGLLESLQTGRETASSALVKTVENSVAEKEGKSKLPIGNIVNNKPIQNTSKQAINEVDMSPERDEQLFADIERNRKRTLTDSIQNFTKTPMIGAPMNNNVYPTQINENYLNENVRKIVDNYLVENFTPIIEETFKGAIIEMFAVERIKEVLHQNKDLIRTVVIETIKDIQAKSKLNKN